MTKGEQFSSGKIRIDDENHVASATYFLSYILRCLAWYIVKPLLVVVFRSLTACPPIFRLGKSRDDVSILQCVTDAYLPFIFNFIHFVLVFRPFATTSKNRNRLLASV